MALPEIYCLSGMMKEVQSLISIVCRRELSLLNGMLNRVQELLQSFALTAAIGMGVVAVLFHGLVAGITQGVNTAVIGDTRVVADVDLSEQEERKELGTERPVYLP